MHDVFLSFASPDRPVADAACHALEEAGIRVWIAPRDVDPGQPYAQCITKAIRSCTLMVVIFSQDANASEYVAREVEMAARERKPMLPMRVDSVEPSDELTFFTGRSHWLDALTPPIEAHLSRLVSSVKKIVERGRPTTSPPLSAVPVTYSETEAPSDLPSVPLSAPATASVAPAVPLETIRDAKAPTEIDTPLQVLVVIGILTLVLLVAGIAVLRYVPAANL